MSLLKAVEKFVRQHRLAEASVSRNVEDVIEVATTLPLALIVDEPVLLIQKEINEASPSAMSR